jgi:integrase
MSRRQTAVPYPRAYTDKKGKKYSVWWYYVTDDAGKRHRFSLGTKLKTEARYLLDQKIKSDDLMTVKSKAVSLSIYAESFWTWDKCTYVRRKKVRGDRISQRWVVQNRGYLRNHILPFLGLKPLHTITPAQIEDFLAFLKDRKELSNKSVNNIQMSLRAIFSEAQRDELITSNPAKIVKPLRNEYTQRGILTTEESKTLLQNPGLWRSHVHYAINVTAATTGARLGELQGLKVRCVRPDRIVIDGVYRRNIGFVEHDTKTGETGLRIIPIPQFTRRTLAPLIEGKDDDAFVFTLNGSTPIAGNTVTRGLHAALTLMGLPTALQSERNVDFHSWRHFYGSILRGHVTDVDLRHVVGHTTEAMTERYSHRLPAHVKKFAQAQERAFQEVLPQDRQGQVYSRSPDDLDCQDR